ncbi:nostrin isoform X2 [Ascaphus truei]|uniref:nostrin isoform X2 n=1 Tax=Ascaphus truei TaxID=8439 RepID=UPI003F59A142
MYLFKMKDPLTGSTYERVYQDLKNISKNGEIFCKSLMSVLQQRSNLEMNYAKGLEKVANKLTKALDNMKKKNLGMAIQLEAIKPTNQVLEEQEKRKKKLDNDVEKMTNSVLSNWRQQIKVKKKLMDHTKKHEATFHLAENTKQSVTEKEKQKLLNKLKKSAETLTKTDEEYYQENIAGQAVRLKWESLLENCYQSIQELEKERIQLLSHILTRYNQHVSNFGQTLNTCQSQIDQAIKNIDVEKDIQTFMEETTIFSEDNKSEFLLLDYYEEDGSSVMDEVRRIASMKIKVERLQCDIQKASRDKDGLEKMVKAYTENPAFSDEKTEEDTAALLEETNLKLNLLEANSFKLESALAEREKRPAPSHPCKECIITWKEKGCQHCSVQICRPFNTKKLQRSQSERTSKRPSSRLSSTRSAEYCTIVPNPTDYPRRPSRRQSQRVSKEEHGLSLEEAQNTSKNKMNDQANGSCKVLYPYQPQREDELSLQKGDHLTVQQKDDSGWWYGTLNGKKGYFPSAYVEEQTAEHSISHA